MAIDFDSFFTKAGKILAYCEQINTDRSGIKTPAKAVLDAFNNDSLELKRAIDQIESSHRSIQDGASAGISAAAQSLRQVLIETMAADSVLDSKDEITALNLLISQMVTAAESVEESIAAASVAADSGNNGDGQCVVSIKRADGKNQQNAYVETIRVEVSSATTPKTATLTCRGDVAQRDKLAHDWPMGSGANRTITAVDAAGSVNLLGNGGFDEETDIDNAPDDWIVSIGTIGTTVKMTDYEVQRIVVTGPPTAGYYRVSVTNAAGKVQTTDPLDYAATGSTLQAALNALTGFENVTVSTTGTSPLFTHDITFTGVAGNIAQLTVTNGTTGGTYTPSTVTGGSANAYVGKAIEFDSDGSQLTTINRRVTLDPLTQYAVNLWAMADVVPAAGVITVDLVDGIGGTVINGQLGTANTFNFTGAGLTTSFVAKNGSFRTPRILPPIVYLRIRISTAVSAGTSVFIDHCAMAKMTEVYNGGPFVAVFSGKTDFTAGDGANVLPDGFTITVTNSRAGEFQEWFNRVFSMADKGLLLPSASTSSETQADSLIA